MPFAFVGERKKEIFENIQLFDPTILITPMIPKTSRFSRDHRTEIKWFQGNETKSR